jgi:exonuclease V gamma subunit
VSGVIVCAWRMVEDQELWREGYRQLSDFQAVIGYQEEIKGLLKRYTQNDQRKIQAQKIISRQWNMIVQEAFPEEMQPHS